MGQLRMLVLSKTRVTDVGARQLAQLKRLRTLYLTNTRVSQECAAELRRSLPECDIIHSQLGRRPQQGILRQSPSRNDFGGYTGSKLLKVTFPSGLKATVMNPPSPFLCCHPHVTVVAELEGDGC